MQYLGLKPAWCTAVSGLTIFGLVLNLHVITETSETELDNVEKAKTKWTKFRNDHDVTHVPN